MSNFLYLVNGFAIGLAVAIIIFPLFRKRHEFGIAQIRPDGEGSFGLRFVFIKDIEDIPKYSYLIFKSELINDNNP